MARTAHTTHCMTCGTRIHRMNVGAADPEYGRFVNFDEDPDGAWIQNPLTGRMRRVGSGVITNLARYSPHSCLNHDALD